MKTIFYKLSNDEKGDYWFGNASSQKPYKEWFSLDVLYYPHGDVVKRTIQKESKSKIVRSVTISEIQDTFSDDGIIRRIALHISGN